MKHTSTLALALALMAGSAQAQIDVNGTLSAGEIGSGPGKYTLVNTYTGFHSEANRGLGALYVGSTDTTLHIFIVESPEKANYNATLVYLDVPNRTGVPAGVQLPSGDDNTSQFRSRPTLDMEADYGFRMTSAPTGNDNAYYSRIDYVGPRNAQGQADDIYLYLSNKQGVPFTVTDSASGTKGGKFAYQTGAADVGANTNTGWEFSLPWNTVGGAAPGQTLRLMVAYVDDNATFYSDVIPQIPNLTVALGADPDFSARAGTQAVDFTVQFGQVAVKRAVANSRDMSVMPNPVSASSKLTCDVPAGTSYLHADVYNMLGQKVMTLADVQNPAAGRFVQDLTRVKALGAGTYLVSVLIGESLLSTRVVVE